MRTRPTPLNTLAAVFQGYLPRLFQLRGWLLAALPLVVALGGLALMLLVKPKGGGSALPLALFHQGLATVMVPILALVAAPAGVREDLEQRVLPFMLVRPAQVWVLPLARGAGWFLWGALWLGVACLALGLEASLLPLHLLGLVLAYWAELAFVALVGLVFRRGTLWGALALLVWDPLVRILPGRLQWFTFAHHLQAITGTRSIQVRTQDLLAQPPVEGSVWVSALVLVAVGAACWALAGWRLQATPVGLAGPGSEG